MAADKQTNFKLTDEEKAVLLECRRNSIARGVPIGVVSVLGLRYFINQGILPHSIKRWSVFYYAGTFLVTTVIGMASYRQKCMDKIMALENSYLADQLRQHMSGQTGGPCFPDPSVKKGSASHEKPNTESLPLPTTNSEQYTSTTNTYNDMWMNPTKGNNENNSVVKKGQTFDEIREENRSKQIKQNFPPLSSRQSVRKVENDNQERTGISQPLPPQNQTQGTGVPRPVRRNKYGDIVYED